jgi:hypothetical protein
MFFNVAGSFGIIEKPTSRVGATDPPDGAFFGDQFASFLPSIVGGEMKPVWFPCVTIGMRDGVSEGPQVAVIGSRSYVKPHS